ncbi:MAG: cache domain-containing protein [Desulfocapsaceae bacterium]|nr:cache domain-containing protein [Desulfocapsaceae bacterium]
MNPGNIIFFLKKSLKTRVTLFSLIILLMSILSLAFYGNRILRRDLQDMVSDQQFSTATFVANEINDELKNRLQALENFAYFLKPDLLGNKAALQALLESRETLLSLFNAGIFITGIDGIVVADTPVATGRIGLNIIERDYLQAALKEDKTSVGRPVVGKKLMTPVFAMATPIHDAEGKVTGALVGVIDLSIPNFLDNIAQHPYAKTGGYLLIAPQHKLFITGTDKRHIMQPTPSPGTNSLYDRFAQGFEGSGVVVDSRGVKVLSSAKQIPAAGWILVVKIPTAEAFSPIHTTQRRMILNTILVTVLAGVLTWWILGHQLAPMLVAARIVDAQSDSRQPVRPLPISNPDEIGRLIGGFNHLLEILSHREEEIRRSRDELEIRVQERTDELAKTVDILKEQAELLDLAYDAIFANDSDAIIRYWNSGAEKTYGWTKEEAFGKKPHDLLKTQFPIPLEDIVACTLATGQWEGELRHITKNGVPIVVASRWGVHKNLDGDFLGFLEINRNITERIKMREERENLISNLNEALANIKTLSGLLPTCASCKRIKNSLGNWEQMEFYIQQRSDAKFSHGLCPECTKELYPDMYDQLIKQKII